MSLGVFLEPPSLSASSIEQRLSFFHDSNHNGAQCQAFAQPPNIRVLCLFSDTKLIIELELVLWVLWALEYVYI